MYKVKKFDLNIKDLSEYRTSYILKFKLTGFVKKSTITKYGDEIFYKDYYINGKLINNCDSDEEFIKFLKLKSFL